MLPPDIHFWLCPCLVGVALPSGNGGLLLLRRLRHAGRTSHDLRHSRRLGICEPLKAVKNREPPFGGLIK